MGADGTAINNTPSNPMVMENLSTRSGLSTRQASVDQDLMLDVTLEHAQTPPVSSSMNWFQKYLSVWVLLAMVGGVLLGYFVPPVAHALDQATVAQVSIPIAVLLWGMILPMMIQVDFRSVANALRQPRAVVLTAAVNYCVQPFLMYGLARLFFHAVFYEYLGKDKADSYLIGSVLLGSAPCTAMVFVWSLLM
jgi:ACR3 family arsenite transporter